MHELFAYPDHPTEPTEQAMQAVGALMVPPALGTRTIASAIRPASFPTLRTALNAPAVVVHATGGAA